MERVCWFVCVSTLVLVCERVRWCVYGGVYGGVHVVMYMVGGVHVGAYMCHVVVYSVFDIGLVLRVFNSGWMFVDY